MKTTMKNIVSLSTIIALMILSSCSSDDDSGSNDCEISWTDELIEERTQQCLDTGLLSADACTCSAEQATNEFTPCEVELEENQARLIAIGIGCNTETL